MGMHSVREQVQLEIGALTLVYGCLGPFGLINCIGHYIRCGVRCGNLGSPLEISGAALVCKVCRQLCLEAGN